MQAAGVNLVSVGIFSWAWLEPRSGHYEFGWLDRVLDLLHQHGIQACLATATASPPPWLAHRHPESLPVTADGVTLWPGGRQAYCPHSAAYRKTAAELVTRLAERYRNHPGPGDLAHQQRVRLPRQRVLLRPVGCRLPPVAAPALRHARRAQRGLGHGLLEPALRRLGRDQPAAPCAYLCQPDPAARLAALLVRQHPRTEPDGAGDPPAHHARACP